MIIIFFPCTEENCMLSATANFEDTLCVSHQPLWWCHRGFTPAERQPRASWTGSWHLLQGDKVTASACAGISLGLPAERDGCELRGELQDTPSAYIKKSAKCLNPLEDDSCKRCSAWSQAEGKPRVRPEGWSCDASMRVVHLAEFACLETWGSTSQHDLEKALLYHRAPSHRQVKLLAKKMKGSACKVRWSSGTLAAWKGTAPPASCCLIALRNFWCGANVQHTLHRCCNTLKRDCQSFSITIFVG